MAPRTRSPACGKKYNKFSIRRKYPSLPRSIFVREFTTKSLKTIYRNVQFRNPGPFPDEYTLYTSTSLWLQNVVYSEGTAQAVHCGPPSGVRVSGTPKGFRRWFSPPQGVWSLPRTTGLQRAWKLCFRRLPVPARRGSNLPLGRRRAGRPAKEPV